MFHHQGIYLLKFVCSIFSIRNQSNIAFQTNKMMEPSWNNGICSFDLNLYSMLQIKQFCTTRHLIGHNSLQRPYFGAPFFCLETRFMQFSNNIRQKLQKLLCNYSFDLNIHSLLQVSEFVPLVIQLTITHLRDHTFVQRFFCQKVDLCIFPTI